MLATTTLALLVLAHLEAAAGSSFCGGFDLDNNGQAGQCLSDDNSRNGTVPSRAICCQLKVLH